MSYLATSALLLPLLGFLVLFSFYEKVTQRAAGLIACSTVFCAFLLFVGELVLFLHGGMETKETTLFQMVPESVLPINFTLTLDSISILMTLIVTGIGFLIHVYSIGYMGEDKSAVRYFAYLNFFIFAMLLLVTSGDLVLLFFGWEGVGLASYFLIGFWTEKESATSAATKAFVMNRIGDFGFLLALILTFTLFGSTHIASISIKGEQLVESHSVLLTVITLLYFLGSIGKSAQFPLYTWLPDAMEGPTPVSALIHAATMVTAGVYLIVRLHALFILAPITLQIIGLVGGVTTLFAALCAFGQTDLKRVLAFSTVSQLGLMFLACGTGAFYSAMFHLTTHAFAKALLFLSAGNVVHMMHGTTEMAKMGGLRHIFKKTHWLFLIGALALAGLPPFAIFFSKDLILENEYLSGHEILFYVGFAASMMTGVYMMRAYCLTFLGKSHMSEHERMSIHEAPKVMLVPVAILAVLTLTGGSLAFSYGQLPLFEDFLKEVGITQIEIDLHSGFEITLATLGVMTCAFIAVAITYFIYTREKTPQAVVLFKNQFYINEIYDTVFVMPLKRCAWWVANFFEPKVFEGSMAYMTQCIYSGAKTVQLLQNGQIRSYIAYMVFGTALVIIYML